MCRTYWQFLSRVAAGRSMSMQQARKVARGRIWTGEDALQLGLVDKLGGLKDAVYLAKQEAGLSQVSQLSMCARSVSLSRSAYRAQNQFALAKVALMFCQSNTIGPPLFLTTLSIICYVLLRLPWSCKHEKNRKVHTVRHRHGRLYTQQQPWQACMNQAW